MSMLESFVGSHGPGERRRFQLLLEALEHQAFWVTDRDGRWLEDSARFRQMTGQTIDQSRGTGWKNAIHPVDRPDFEATWTCGSETHDVVHVRHRLRQPDGQYRWAETRIVPVVEGERVMEWLGVTSDVHGPTVLAEGSRVLRRANELFMSTLEESVIVERLPELIVPSLADICTISLLNGEEESTVIHSATGSIEGLNVAEFDWKHLEDESIRKERAISIHEIPGGLRDFGVEAILVVPMSVRGKHLGSFRLLSIDPHRHHGKEELELLTEVARRAATAIDNARLYAQAADANRARDIFLATLSHEMKTPLTAILGWTSMLKSDGRDSQLFGEALDAIEESARVQERLIEDVLDVSRIITGKLHIDKKPLPLHGVVRSSMEMITPAARQSGVHLRFHEDSDAVIYADAMRLRQVIWNLLTNAVKFTPAGGFIEIRTSRTEREAVLSVRDSGRGIRAEALPHVFDQFHQNTLADRAKHHGLGLGLSIVRHLVRAHGGSVEARSAGEGKGAEFIVRLPLLA
jgi:PAS domain S-box-containing protein